MASSPPIDPDPSASPPGETSTSAEVGDTGPDAARDHGPDQSQADEPSRSGASSVAAGIFSSRITGLIRERVVAHFFGVGAVADVWAVVFRVPNILQNLLGEGTISAAFIPTYSRLIDDGRHEDAGRFAGAIFGLLLAVAAAISIAGILLAGPIVAISAPGFLNDAAQVAAGTLSVDRYALSVQALRITFPMTGVLVLAAWALGVLNSHRRFFVPYVAPVLWNVATIACLAGGALYWTGSVAGTGVLDAGPSDVDTLSRLLLAGCGGALLGGVLQFGVQLPFVAQQIRGFEWSLSMDVVGVRDAVRAVGPVIAGRGVAQVSAFLDQFLASVLLAAGALSGLRFALLLYMLPISLFGISVTAAELPELSRLGSDRAGEPPADAERVGNETSPQKRSTNPVGDANATETSNAAAGDSDAGGPAAGDSDAGGPAAGDSDAGGPAAGDSDAGGPAAGDPVDAFVERLRRSLGQLAFLTVPTVVGYGVFGYLLVGALLRTGQFGVQDQWLVYLTLVTYSAGILATAMSRLLQNAFYAINDTSTPARLAVVRVAISTAVAIPMMLLLRGTSVGEVVGQSFGSTILFLGVLGLGIGASAGAWVELTALLRALRRSVPAVQVPWSSIGRMALLSVVTALPALGLWAALPGGSMLLLAPAVGGAFAAAYLGAAYLLDLPELRPWIQRFRRA